MLVGPARFELATNGSSVRDPIASRLLIFMDFLLTLFKIGGAVLSTWVPTSKTSKWTGHCDGLPTSRSLPARAPEVARHVDGEMPAAVSQTALQRPAPVAESGNGRSTGRDVQRQLPGLAANLRSRPSGDTRSKQQQPFGRSVEALPSLECITI